MRTSEHDVFNEAVPSLRSLQNELLKYSMLLFEETGAMRAVSAVGALTALLSSSSSTTFRLEGEGKLTSSTSATESGGL